MPAGRPRAGNKSAAGAPLAYLLMAVWSAGLMWVVWAKQLPAWTLGAALALNLATFIVYAMDKRAARIGGWRVSERQLHLLALLGGWPAAWAAQQWLRHKSSKASFRAVYWATVVLHCTVLLAAALLADTNALRF